MEGKKYRILMADPPWRFKSWSGRGGGKGAVQHYDCMDLDALERLPVADWAAPDCALFLWVVQSMLPEALQLIGVWGFEFKTVAYAWVKIKGGQPRLYYEQGDAGMGMGYHTRAGFEQCWLATRGKGYSRISKGEPQVIFAPRREHSRKPDEIAESIVRLCGDLPRLEMFARTRRPGWAVFGNETDKFDAA